jgi:hypothetical protein
MNSTDKAINIETIETILQLRRNQLAEEYSVSEIGVFGSFVRGESSPDSDIDILIEFNKPIGLFKFLEIEERLGEWLGRKVDLVTKAALKPYIGSQIMQEVTMI